MTSLTAAQNKVVVTGIEDEVEIKTFTMSNSEKIYTSLIDFVNKEVSNLVLGSESMAGGMQSYVGSTKAHQDIFRNASRFTADSLKTYLMKRLCQDW